MRVLYSPIRSDDKLSYEFVGDEITVTLNGQSEIFDFADMPNGRLENVETDLPINPIVNAEKIDGELFVTLVYFHGPTATHDELYPQWQEVLEDGTFRAIESETDF
ncbi:hypothetical protein ABE096_13865 [Robertmurraya massiliosenegalensis]